MAKWQKGRELKIIWRRKYRRKSNAPCAVCVCACVCARALVLSMCQLMVYTSFSNASVPSAWLSNVAALKYMKICSFLACKSSFFRGLGEQDTHTLKQLIHTVKVTLRRLEMPFMQIEYRPSADQNLSLNLIHNQERRCHPPWPGVPVKAARMPMQTAGVTFTLWQTHSDSLWTYLAFFSVGDFPSKRIFFLPGHEDMFESLVIFFSGVNYSPTSSWATHISNKEFWAHSYFHK